MHKLIHIALIVCICLLAPALAAANGVHPLFNLQSTTQSPFPSDRFTVRDFRQNTNQLVNLPLPDCTTHPSDCLDVALLNQLDATLLQSPAKLSFFSGSETFLIRRTFIRRLLALIKSYGTQPRSLSLSSQISIWISTRVIC